MSVLKWDKPHRIDVFKYRKQVLKQVLKQVIKQANKQGIKKTRLLACLFYKKNKKISDINS